MLISVTMFHVKHLRRVIKLEMKICLDKASELSEVVYKNAVEKKLCGSVQKGVAHILCEVSEAWRVRSVLINETSLSFYKEYQGRIWKSEVFKDMIKGSLNEELADIYISILSVSQENKIDLGFFWGVFQSGDLRGDNSVESVLNMVSLRIAKLSKRDLIKNSSSWMLLNESLYCVEVIAAKCNIDLLYFVEEKIKFNKTRAIGHSG